MRGFVIRAGLSSGLAVAVSAAPAQLPAQTPRLPEPTIVVNGQRLPDTSAMTPGPDVKGTIVARSADRIKVLTSDGTQTIVYFNDTTRIRAGGGLFGVGNAKVGPESLLNGIPVTVKTMQAGNVLLASQITFRNSDLKIAAMIRNGTAQGFAEQTAATQALRSRVSDIDNYNIKSTTNVNFDSGKATLSERAKVDLCNAAAEAEGISNALLLVIGYTDSTGSAEVNQALSEKRAANVINYLQQVCHWKPYRMLTPAGMATADPLASNDTPEGKAQNRRVAVNIMVSKAVDGM